MGEPLKYTLIRPETFMRILYFPTSDAAAAGCIADTKGSITYSRSKLESPSFYAPVCTCIVNESEISMTTAKKC